LALRKKLHYIILPVGGRFRTPTGEAGDQFFVGFTQGTLIEIISEKQKNLVLEWKTIQEVKFFFLFDV
jgi:hypothetical protein